MTNLSYYRCDLLLLVLPFELKADETAWNLTQIRLNLLPVKFSSTLVSKLDEYYVERTK